MTKMSRYALITALAMFLAGCVGQREPAPVEEVKPAPEQPTEPQQPVPTVPSVPTIPQQPGPIEHEDQTAPPAPHIRHYDWNGAMQPMVSKMLGADGVTAGSVLLVDSVNNRTNGS
ncbi:TPA: penicillin-binding protein activator LpoB, partial [Escherichia coli]